MLANRKACVADDADLRADAFSCLGPTPQGSLGIPLFNVPLDLTDDGRVSRNPSRKPMVFPVREAPLDPCSGPPMRRLPTCSLTDFYNVRPQITYLSLLYRSVIHE